MQGKKRGGLGGVPPPTESHEKDYKKATKKGVVSGGVISAGRSLGAHHLKLVPLCWHTCYFDSQLHSFKFQLFFLQGWPGPIDDWGILNYCDSVVFF